MTFYDTCPLLKINNDSSTLNQFLHECVDDLTHKSKATFDNYDGGKIEWTEEDYDKTLKCIQNFYRQCVIEDKFHLEKEFPQNINKAVENCYQISKKYIFEAVANECILTLGHSLLTNFDWKLVWILGTSTLATGKKPTLKVDMRCSKKLGETQTHITTFNFEASLDLINKMIDKFTELQKTFE